MNTPRHAWLRLYSGRRCCKNCGAIQEYSAREGKWYAHIPAFVTPTCSGQPLPATVDTPAKV